MRWNETVTLLAKPYLHQDEAGNVHTGWPERRERFCNAYTVGADAWSAAIDLGLRADAEVQLRAVDYGGEEEVEFRGVEYDVERVTHSGDFVRLQLGRHASNG